MLPARPSPRAVGGLPTNPSSSRATRIDGAARRYGVSEQDDSSSSSFRHNSPTSNAAAPRRRSRSRSRARASPTPPSSQREYDRPAPIEYRASDESRPSTSSGSSLLDRMQRGYGPSSSRTSIERGEEEKRGGPHKARSLRERRITERNDRGNIDEPVSVPEDGYSIWDKVTTAASTLTVSVSKAWQANMGTNNEGEATPPDQESHLTRAMRAYHLEKAKDWSDLPDWLFSEEERQPVRSRFRSPRSNETMPLSSSQPLKPTGLRDIYAAAAATASPTSPRLSGEDAGTTSKAADRLKAMRDAKRNARAVESDEREASVGRNTRRMGLPPRPGAF